MWLIGGVSDIDYESIPVRAVDGDRRPNPVLVLVEGDAEDLDDLDPPVGRQVEERRLQDSGSLPRRRTGIRTARCRIRAGTNCAAWEILRLMEPGARSRSGRG